MKIGLKLVVFNRGDPARYLRRRRDRFGDLRFVLLRRERLRRGDWRRGIVCTLDSRGIGKKGAPFRDEKISDAYIKDE